MGFLYKDRQPCVFVISRSLSVVRARPLSREDLNKDGYYLPMLVEPGWKNVE